MPEDMFGPPQIAALLILLQRGLEEIHSQRNTRRLVAEGAYEVGRDFYPVVAVTHLAWIAAIFFLVLPTAPVTWLLATFFVLLQFVRYWVIGTLGRYWTHRIMTLNTAPVIRRGPYRFARHPNYVVTIVETFLLPLVFGAWALAIIMTAVWLVVLRYKIVLEDSAIAARPPG